MEHKGEIAAWPSKDFFIDMLTRDIGVTECILDFVDNAIDKAIKVSELDVMSTLMAKPTTQKVRGKSISIDFSAQKFSITDNCGGISKDEARREVFLFGHSDADTG